MRVRGLKYVHASDPLHHHHRSVVVQAMFRFIDSCVFSKEVPSERLVAEFSVPTHRCITGGSLPISTDCVVRATITSPTPLIYLYHSHPRYTHSSSPTMGALLHDEATARLHQGRKPTSSGLTRALIFPVHLHDVLLSIIK